VFAIIQTSGRHFRVEPGAVIAIDSHNAGDAGGEVSFDQVLLVSNDNGDVTAGTPFVTAMTSCDPTKIGAKGSDMLAVL
jgi:ribosomal protein L21